ncbi:MAG TPA: sulfatase-like hydrolase/transferase [Candidatus Sulfotelmatobacter sp.]|jgi:arylsulfatase A-like enzyme|nr:sulfatase-like hydrolase/transferase [Candidatus Sulfotelmatobacter sp.]
MNLNKFFTGIRSRLNLPAMLPVLFFVLTGIYSVMAAGPRPNILFILTDDMGYSDPGCYGGKFAPTPNIDRLAGEGIRFTHFYDNAPICSASRCSYITGMYPARWNFTTYLDNRAHNEDCEQADFLTTNAPALARVMKSAGYQTAHFGKWHLGGGRDVTNAPLFRAYGYDESIGTYESPEPDPNITATDWIWSPKDKVKRWERTGYFVDHVLDFLQRHTNQPCYVELWPDDVHTPWVGNVDQQGRKGSWETKTNFSTVLAEYDRQMGRLFDGLKALGLETNTVVIFTSDNGPLPSFNHARTGGLRGSKLSLYEGGIRVPFIVRWPGHAAAGGVDEQTVLDMVDLFPTFCAIGQGRMPANFTFDGRDMRAVFDNTPATAARTIFWEYGREKSKSFAYPGAVFDHSPHLAVREGKWKLLVNPDGSRVELFDLAADRNETNDVAAANDALTQQLKTAALAWKKSLPVLAE